MRKNNDMAAKPSKLLVIIVGWMGCQERRLEAYKQLYRRSCSEKFGAVEIVPCIPPPYAVIETCLGQTSSMDSIAFNLMERIRQEKCEKMVIHCFSNNGYLLWDSFQRQVSQYWRHDFRLRIGVVFDSCPIVDMSLASDALNYCSWQERAQVIQRCGLDYLDASRLISFSKKVADNLQSSAPPSYALSTVTELFLYSRRDTLAPFNFVDAVVQHRRTRLGPWAVHKQVFEQSRHCDHLRQYPEAYERAVKAMMVTLDQPQFSKL